MTVLSYCAAVHKNIDFFCHSSERSWLNEYSEGIAPLVETGTFSQLLKELRDVFGQQGKGREEGDCQLLVTGGISGLDRTVDGVGFP